MECNFSFVTIVYRYVCTITTIHALSYISTAIARSLLPIQVGIEIPAEAARRIIKSLLLVNAVNLLHIFLIKLEISFQIIFDAAFGLALGNHRSRAKESSASRTQHRFDGELTVREQFPTRERLARRSCCISYQSH